MSDLTPAVRRYITGIVLLALSGTAVALWRQPPDRADLWLGLTFGLGIVFAWTFPVSISFRKKIYVDAAPVFAAVLTMSAGAAMATVATGILIAYLVRRTRRDLVEAVFNASESTISAGVGALVLSLVTWGPRSPVVEGVTSVAEIALASGLMFLANSITLACIIGLHSQQSIARIWVRSTLREDPIEIAAHLSLTTMGVIAALLATERPWATVLLLPPVVAMLIALRHHAQLRERAESALRGSQADLAEAQRIARLGSWEWDLQLARLVWSDQIFRILGVQPQSFTPSLAALLGRVHPEDRARVDAALSEAISGGRSFSVDHRVVLPDGTCRTVHQQGEVLRGERGAPVRMVGTMLDITERKALEAQLAHRAYHDALTNLPNRALFSDRLEGALAAADGRAASVAVLFVDLDDFKLVNDGIGHDAGDRLLIAVAERLRQVLEGRHLAARFGGDEFTILLDELEGPEQAIGVAQRLVTALAEPFTLNGHEVAVSASVGVAHGTAGETQALTLLRAADAALYEAKAAGKHGVAVFHPGMTDAAIRRLDLQSDLRRAVERGELCLLYQPIVELQTDRIAGVEALVRWQHPTHGLVAPESFMSLAEETGLILPLGEWVLRAACQETGFWYRTLPNATQLRVSVNLSVRQLRHEGLFDLVALALREAGLPPDHLELEITEQVVAQDLQAVAPVLDRLRESGVRLSLDDVGSGHSSLGNFQHLTVDTLKLDRSFVSGVAGNSRRRAIAEAVTGLARALSIEVIAEGIETNQDLITARELGCRFGQGYRFARPMPAAEVGQLIARGLPRDITRNLAAVPERAPVIQKPIETTTIDATGVG